MLNDAPGVLSYTLTGSAEAGQPVTVPLSSESGEWDVAGDYAPLPEGTTVEVDVEDGSGRRLGAAAYFTQADLPETPDVLVRDERSTDSEVAAIDDFLRAASSAC